ncbi:hypothetical protein TNCV_4905591 [Trichonephila clavipes]|uniref:Uncharacterized protein n=1 Tax=Trichonephila clavipes TaxID=2585209 RepID=A0A8X6V820_TRICX|nr:hypothetical protein TNCV_4905591 [Trichonephila clavipes]
MIMSLVGRFEELGSVADGPGRGTLRNIRTEGNVETAQQSVVDDPFVSTRLRSCQLGISRTTLCRIFYGQWTATVGLDVIQSGRPIFNDFFQHLWPYIRNNTTNVVFQMVKRLWRIRIDK